MNDFRVSVGYNVNWSSLHSLGQRYFWIDSNTGYLCGKKNQKLFAKYISSYISSYSHFQEMQLEWFRQRLERHPPQSYCYPPNICVNLKRNVLLYEESLQCHVCIYLFLNRWHTGKARWWSVNRRTHSTLFSPNPLILSK